MTLLPLLLALEARADLPALLEDTDLDATFTGEATFDYAGRTISGAADVNGDGLADLLVGAYGSDDGATGGGETYLLLGTADRHSGAHVLSEADASWVGMDTAEYTSLEISLASDLDGDGFDDIAIGTYRNSDVATESGKVYVVYGAASGWTTDTSLASADASWLGQGEYDHAGRSVAGLGDVDGDGFGDLLVGGCWNSDVAYRAGKAYLLTGGSTRWTADTSLAEATAVLAGSEEEEFAARAVAGAGDVDGDGLADLLVGAYARDDGGTDAGEAWLLLGGDLSGEIDLDSGADASFEGEAAGDRAGLVVAAAGDVDADGYGDMLVASYLNDRGATNAGAVYLVLGRASGLAPDTSLEEADAVYEGEDANDYAGRSASGAGDVDGDGFADILIGASGADDGGADAGRAYLVRGSASPTTMSLEDADLIVTGTEAGAEFPYVLAEAGDLDGGGNPDIVLPAYTSGARAREAGIVHLLYTEPWIDQDGDGYSENDGDCDEDDATVHPGATEIPFDGVDQDCDGADSYDADGDGYDAEAWGGDDCDDGEPSVHPGTVELCLDGVDNDCDGFVDWADADGDGIDDCAWACPDPDMDPDQDGDGAVRPECGGNDCDDLDPGAWPGAIEIPYDGVDNDCKGGDLTDVDGDGHDAEAAGGRDCDDGNPGVHPDATEIPYDGVDNDCEGGDLTDVDGDGHDAEAAGGRDCDDGNPSVHPDAEEICDDGIDNDCDDTVDGADVDCGATGDTGEDPCTDDTGSGDTEDDTAADDTAAGGRECGCATSGGRASRAAWAGLLLAALGWTRRRRPEGR